MIKKFKSSTLQVLDFLTKHPRESVLAIFILSAGIRFSLLALYLLNGNHLYSGEADSIARSLVKTGAFADPFAVPTGPTAHCAPVYPAIGALIYASFGFGFAGELARCAVCILAFSLLYSLLPWFASRFGLDWRAGLLAGLVSALLPTKRSVEILGGAWETPYAAIVLALLLAWTLDLWRTQRFHALTAFLWGISWGAASLLATSFFAVFATLGGLFLFLFPRRGSVLAAALAALGCILVLTPWTIRNHNELGAWIFVRSNLGIELEVGNHEGARPDVEENISSFRVHPSTSLERAREVRSLGEVEYNRRALRRAEAWIYRNPAAFLKLSAERCFRFWFSTPIHPLEFAITFPIMVVALWGMVRL